MKTVNKIMVPVDFSEYSLATVTYAAAMARDVGAEMFLVNVINQRDVDMAKKIADSYPDFSLEHYLEEAERDRREQMQGLIASAGCEGITVSTSIRIGVPFKELLAAIERRKPDLVVMSTKGRTNLLDTLIGSCAHKMFRHCPVPLLSVRHKPKNE